jgi:hypothetical protein
MKDAKFLCSTCKESISNENEKDNKNICLLKNARQKKENEMNEIRKESESSFKKIELLKATL